MSRFPEIRDLNFLDAYVCETTMAPVIQEVGSIVDLHLDYIATVDQNSDTGFDCMHGQDEVKLFNN